MTRTPWPIIMLLVLTIAWIASRNWKIVAGRFVTLTAIGYLDMWEDTMRTVSMIFVCTFLEVGIVKPSGHQRMRRNLDDSGRHHAAGVCLSVTYDQYNTG
ncbi:hypothetical protein [Burkholderia vietnamiensis]|uniref:hypothetical protein n=1 Tax=Burkholderia vietnamiensis TaxID=60552 RepID=UPI00264F7882|nr:hypothetical protein [Burkholderia vietnamiensis]MDN8035939.1 hypothetical protein [Burkholderia vietnamiensis]HDR8925041.1 hypothetical protein [Burkholderia vietnamiensis]HDR9215294.1 hypothetical protein [Burkholderia vietnamiensis]